MNGVNLIPYRMLNEPLALHASYSHSVISLLAPGTGPAARPTPRAENVTLPARRRNTADDDRGYDVIEGVAIIPIAGLLVHGFVATRPAWGFTGYNGIRLAMQNAMQDKGIRSIVLDIDSPGGEVAGCFDLADAIFQARGEKPMRAILSENAFSAAYAIASATDRVIVPRTGGVGSIGIVRLIVDASMALFKAGVKVNVIQFGARKADGYPELRLSAQGLARFQAETNKIGRLFAETVARNRGLKTSAIIALEGASFQGAEGVKCGLADRVAAPDEALRGVLETLRREKRETLARLGRGR